MNIQETIRKVLREESSIKNNLRNMIDDHGFKNAAKAVGGGKRLMNILNLDGEDLDDTDHSESLDLTNNFSSSTFDNGHRKATVLVSSLYLGLAPEPCRVPPLPIFFFCIFFAIFCYSVISKIWICTKRTTWIMKT